MEVKVTESTINEFGRYDELRATVNKDQARTFFEALEGKTLKSHQINIRVDELLRRFILEGGFEI